MNIIKRISDWFAARAAVKRVAHEQAGYRFALSATLSELPNAAKLLGNMVDTARTFGDYNDFDRGIERALREQEMPSAVGRVVRIGWAVHGHVGYGGWHPSHVETVESLRSLVRVMNAEHGAETHWLEQQDVPS